MFRREILILGGMVALIFLSVGGIGFFEVRTLHETSVKLVLDTLPGLVDAGLASERIHDHRRILRETLDPHTPAERAQLIATANATNTDALWRDYAASIFAEEDWKNYQTMLRARASYLESCEQFQILVLQGKIDAAKTYYYGELRRQFLNYDDAVNILFSYNVHQGKVRGEIILNNSYYAPWMIAGLCVVIFCLGLGMGLRAAWSGGRIKKPPVHEIKGRLEKQKAAGEKREAFRLPVNKP
jgi:hypothetical protein